MEQFATKDYFWLWTAVLALLLFLPVRHLIWVLLVRRARGKAEDPDTLVDQTEVKRLKKRAGFTSAMVSYLFSLIYCWSLFGGTS